MSRFYFKLRRNTMFLFLIMMPMGIRVDPNHPNDFSVSVHGGTGQVISVLRDCDGNVTTSEENSFQEVAASMQISHRFENGNVLALGVRGGNLDSQAKMPLMIYEYPDRYPSHFEREINYHYWNPYIAWETRKLGIGIGYMDGFLPTIFGKGDTNIPLSFHLRLGNYRNKNFQISMNEDLPLAAGTGYYRLGIGYPVGSRAQLFTGLSSGFYEDIGFVQKISMAISDRFDLELSTRLGSTDSKFQGGAALGLRYHIPFGTAYKTQKGQDHIGPAPLDFTR